MLIYTDLEYKILELVRQYNITSTLSNRLTFGGGPGTGGGSGGPITTPIGQLPQTYVCYDTSELATTYVPGSGTSLLDNLNRIRSGYVIVPSGYIPINFTVTGTGNLFDYLEGIDNELATISGGMGGYGSITDGQIPKFEGTTTITDSVLSESAGKISFPVGTGINEFSNDGTLAGDSDDAVPTEKAVKTYVDSEVLPGSGHVIEDDTPQTFPHRGILQFTDDGSCVVTVTDDLGNNRTIVNVSGTASGGGAGHTIRDSDEDFTQRTGLQFLGNVIVTDDAGDDETVVTISGAGGHQIRDADSIFTPRSGLQFIGDVTVTDDVGDDETIVEVTISGGAMKTYIDAIPAPDGAKTEFTVTTG